ncbi:hypothetical protein BOX15_Mlig008993g5 [Macrostomum lignano]|uniref:Uncharacterized protein n=1 Tax=Macrostomum lignano TaxID=282301 RepID=A0A267FWM5_9PLAT|nr:hypothetical protein BOX15_Mlig008993g4 [Macrostomum lignano]PAA54038.1 hypothetical protein BOX15_Mlig008993g3 [Macrostomum lignano]PAA69270.1 hypothetical protein BOX15_Mlig008993g2 [Macrostomum lignano]PAA69386.1 hypothetical protein BOX15_Mlig008993g1 [Macrostomum lignano]PAA77634.1 hypothetical protein BOX15_Mlig008993g5 [Macrostomum lignano]
MKRNVQNQIPRMKHRLPNPMLLAVVIMVAGSCLQAAGAPSRSPTPAEESANRYIDLLMAKLGPHLRENNMDPLPLDNLVIDFSKKILLVTVHGSIGLTDGRMHGLSTLHRSGDCRIETQGNTLTIDANRVL